MALTNNDASIILGMLARGDKNHDIASWFGENPARVAEVKDGEFGNYVVATDVNLPPKGAPGPKGRKLKAFVAKAILMLEDENPGEALQALKDGIAKYDRHEA